MRPPEALQISQNIWTESPAAGLSIVNDEPSFERKEKEKRTAELLIANKKLAFQNEEKEKRAAELIVINKELKKAQAEIIKLNEELEQKIIERTAQLESANKALEAFSYSVSHDLGAPLRAVMGFAKIIQMDYGARMEPKLKELFKHIISSATRMSAIIDSLLNLAKYSKGKFKCAPVDMTHLTKDVWSNRSEE